MLSGRHHLSGSNLSAQQISPTRIPLRATFDLVSVQSPGEHMPSYSGKKNGDFYSRLYLFTYVFLFYLISLSPSASHLTAVLMTCCPSCPSWLCGASVLSLCLNVLLWRSSFMKGESSYLKKMLNDHLLCFYEINKNLFKSGFTA